MAMQRAVYYFSLILVVSCSGRGKRAAIQQEAAITDPGTSVSDASVADPDTTFDPMDPFAPDPTLDEEALNGNATDDSDMITDVIEQSANNTANESFGDFFNDVGSDTAETATSDIFGAETNSILDPSSGIGSNTGLDEFTPLSGLNGLTTSDNSMDLNSILNGVASTSSTGTAFDGGGGVSQILQMSSQLFD